ncbi:Gfo/Idh/MocA family protein [Tropicimonas sp. IMCC34043]|uniref:Gfo/Idh/MocA family protein n=1 Tax=Tropicimonas sp. IMCC34043 TaxID=2248760 RepID=UPI000E22A04F|nr:Gfo/Idh/MocA family oxidoreductase [Tropicimonas sp. IMCC34043]
MGISTAGATLPLGIALIGAGMGAKPHIAAIAQARDHVSLCGVLTRRPESAAALVSGLPDDIAPSVRAYRGLDDLLSDGRVQAAIVATPPDVRASLIAPLAAAGLHVLLEKPVARSFAEAEEVVALCEDAGVTLGVVFQHRLRAASRAARKLVDGGALGRLGVVEIAVPWWRGQGYYDEPGRGSYARDGGGVLITQAIHTMDLALSLTGPVRSVQAMTATSVFHRMEAEDVAVAGLSFENGAVGSLVASTASFPGAPETIVLHFEAASLRLDSGVLTVSWRDGRVETRGETAATGGGADPMAFTHEWHQAVIEDFADAVRTGTPPAAPGRAALLVHKLIAAIETSAREGRSVAVGP